MVTAGVYMVVRNHVLFDMAPVALATVGIIGGITALFAATIGISAKRHQTSVGLFYGQPVGVHVFSLWRWGLHRCHLPPCHTRLFQSPALPISRARSSIPWRENKISEKWEA